LDASVRNHCKAAFEGVLIKKEGRKEGRNSDRPKGYAKMGAMGMWPCRHTGIAYAIPLAPI